MFSYSPIYRICILYVLSLYSIEYIINAIIKILHLCSQCIMHVYRINLLLLSLLHVGLNGLGDKYLFVLLCPKYIDVRKHVPAYCSRTRR